MATLVMLQNRTLPPQQGGARVVYSWPMDAVEPYCPADDAFTSTADRVIVAGTDRCALHVMAEGPCVAGFRSPPECQHGRIDPTADPAAPRCLTCGLVGADVSDRWLRTAMFRDRDRAPSEVIGDEAIMLGEPEES